MDRKISNRILDEVGEIYDGDIRDVLDESGSEIDGFQKFSAAIDRRRIKQAVLDDAQIVFTTLSLAGSGILNKISTQFDVVVIDEAAQAVEPSTLIPLVSVKAKQAFIVGDPAQLPATILSMECVQNGYDQSLFKRLLNSGFPVKSLTMQYRMHPEMMVFR